MRRRIVNLIARHAPLWFLKLTMDRALPKKPLSEEEQFLAYLKALGASENECQQVQGPKPITVGRTNVRFV